MISVGLLTNNNKKYFNGSNLSPVIIELVSEVVNAIPEHKKLGDFKPYSNVVKLKSLFQTALMATAIPLTNVSLELQRLQKENREDELDMEKLLAQQQDVFIFEFLRQMSVNVVRSIYEHICLFNCSLKLTDKLTKDAYKSLERKLVKYSSVEAGKRIVSTRLYSGALTIAASLTIDLVRNFYYPIEDFVTETWNKGISSGLTALKKFDYADMSKQLMKSFLSNSFSLVFGAVGMGFGAVFCFPMFRYMVPSAHQWAERKQIFPFFFEALGSVIGIALVQQVV
jgi:hypothetical protein